VKRKLWFVVALVLIAALMATAYGCGPSPEQPQDTSQSTDNQAQEPQVDKAQVTKDAVVQYYAKMPQHTYKIGLEELKDALGKTPDQYVVFDIRKPEDYAKGHIKGAINVPFAQIGSNLGVFVANSKGKTPIVTCYTGQTAGQAVCTLNVLGIPARSLHLGMDKGWLAQGYPVDTEAVTAKPAEDLPNTPEITAIKEAVEAYYSKMPQHIYKIAEQELKDALDKTSDQFVVIDIRKPEDFAKGHIKDAVNIPFAEVGNNLDKIADLSKGKTPIVACYTGQTAGQTVAALNLVGTPARSLNLGMVSGWEAKGFPEVK